MDLNALLELILGPLGALVLLALAVFALYVGLISPRHIVQELRGRALALEKERIEQNAVIVKLTEQNGELAVQNAGLRASMKFLSEQIAELKHEMELLQRRLREAGQL